MKKLTPLCAFAFAALLTVGCSSTGSVLESPSAAPLPPVVEDQQAPAPAPQPSDTPMAEVTDDR